MSDKLFKYPRTHHIEGSRLQPGDEDLSAIPFKELEGKHLVVEEKVDGANAGISFDEDGNLLLQSRGHYLTGGHRERHFNMFKQWANFHRSWLHQVLGNEYVLYGEWLYAKHTVFYDELPHYFMEFDIYEKASGLFLSTKRRQELLAGRPIISVRVLHEGPLPSLKSLKAFIGHSAFISGNHLDRLREKASKLKLDVDRAIKETDFSTDMEGLYVKVEEEGLVKGRYKYIRREFLTAVLQAEGHWQNRPIIPNGLSADADMFKPCSGEE